MDSDYYNDPDYLIAEARYEAKLLAKEKDYSYLLNPRLLAGTSQGIRNLLGIKKTMQIQILATAIETKPTAKGSYQQLEVTFKNLTFNKTESKKIMSFGAGISAFKVLSEAQQGQVYDVTVVKNAQGYNDWTVVTLSTGEAPSAAPSAINSPKAAVGATRSTYETPEERAQRQILIVRQSSLSAAVATLSVGAKLVKPDEAIAVAKQYENYVFDVKDPGPSGFEDLPDFDIPQVQ